MRRRSLASAPPIANSVPGSGAGRVPRPVVHGAQDTGSPVPRRRLPDPAREPSAPADAEPADRGDQRLGRRLAHRAQRRAPPFRLVDRDAARRRLPGRSSRPATAGPRGRPPRAGGRVARAPARAPRSFGRRPAATSRSASSLAACSTVSLSSRSASYGVGTAPAARPAAPPLHAGPTWCGTSARPPPPATTAMPAASAARTSSADPRSGAEPARAPAGPAATADPVGRAARRTPPASGTAVHGSSPIRPCGVDHVVGTSAPCTANGARSRSVGSRRAAFRLTTSRTGASNVTGAA